jgi:hypothetical protein
VIDVAAQVLARASDGDPPDPPDPPPPLPGPEPETNDDPPWEPTTPVSRPDPMRWPRHEPRPDAEAQLEPFDEADEGSEAGPPTGPGVGFEPEDQAEEEDGDVDRFSLAREFGRLLQGGEDRTDG